MRRQTVVAITTADGTRHQVTQERHPARSYGRGFVILFTDAMAAAAKNIKRGVTLRLLIVLPEHLNFTDFRQLRTVDVAATLETDSGTISRSLAELLNLGIVEREGKGPRTAWRLTSDWGWNGTADQYHAFRGGRMKGKKPPGATGLKSQNAYYGKLGAWIAPRQ